MPQCSAGSRPQAGAPAYSWFTWQVFSAWVSTKLSRFGSDVWSYFVDSPFDVSVFCATEPTIPATPSVGDWLGFFTFDFAARVKVEQYLLAAFRSYLWPSLCECIPSGGTYTCSTLITHPASLPTATGDEHDYGFGVEFVPAVNVTIYGGWLKVHTVGTGLVQHGVVESGGAGLSYIETVVPTATDTRYFFATPQALLAGHTYKYFYQFPGSGWTIDYNTINTTPTTIGSIYYSQHVYKNPIASAWLTHSPATTYPDPLFCPPLDRYYPIPPVDPTAIPDAPVVTCSTTADLCAQISHVLQAILKTNRDVNWLQSSEAPTCWVPGTPLVGLTGAGTFAVTDCVGVYVQLTIPGTWGRTSETPARMIPKLGEFHPTVSGVQVQQRELHYAAEQILDFPIATDGIAYSLKPGVSATMTPLLRCK